MSDNEQSRLDRLEKIVESNARAIEATTANVADLNRDRARVYQLMEDLVQAEAEGKREMYRLMGELSQAEAETKREMYRLMVESNARQNELSRRQAEIVEILKLLTGKIL